MSFLTSLMRAVQAEAAGQHRAPSPQQQLGPAATNVAAPTFLYVPVLHP